MPNIRSAKKRVRSNGRRAKVNMIVSGSMKTAIKNFEKDIELANVEDAKKDLNLAIQRIDKAKDNGLIHKNKASREKSRLTKKLNKLTNK